MRIVWWSLVASVALLHAPVTQVHADEDVKVIGTGNGSCATYTNSIKGLSPGQRVQLFEKGTHREMLSANFAYENWIMGFISAFNADKVASHLTRAQIDVDYQGIIGYVQRWCGEHPAESMIDATFAFVGSRKQK